MEPFLFENLEPDLLGLGSSTTYPGGATGLVLILSRLPGRRHSGIFPEPRGQESLFLAFLKKSLECRFAFAIGGPWSISGWIGIGQRGDGIESSAGSKGLNDSLFDWIA